MNKVTIPLKDIFVALYWVNEVRARHNEAWFRSDILDQDTQAAAPWVMMHTRSLADKPHTGPATADVDRIHLVLLKNEFKRAGKSILVNAELATPLLRDYHAAQAAKAEADYQVFLKNILL